MTVLRTAFISLCMYFSLAGASQAAIIDRGDYLTDTATGLDWLDVTKTVNMSFNAVSGMLGAGGTYAGWRYATGDEFNTLVGNYTGVAITPGSYGAVDQATDRIDGLVTMLGSTLDAYWSANFGKTYDADAGFSEGEALDYTIGILADSVANLPGSRWVASLYDGEAHSGATALEQSVAHKIDLDVTFQRVDIGSFLVRPTVTVPEPGAVALLAIGLVGLAATRRRTARRN